MKILLHETCSSQQLHPVVKQQWAKKSTVQGHRKALRIACIGVGTLGEGDNNVERSIETALW